MNVGERGTCPGPAPQPEPEDAPRHDEWFADAPRPEGVPEPTDDVPYRWSRAAWNAALRVVSQPTREQIAEAIKSAKRGPDDWYLDVADAVIALYGKSEANLSENA